MSDPASSLRTHTTAHQQSPIAVFGTVTLVSGKIMLEGDRCTPGLWPISEQAEHLGLLADGDRVAGTLVDQQKVIATSRLVPGGQETPTLIDELDDGRLLFNAPQGLILQAGSSRIELRADGTVLIDGEDIHTLAHRRYLLQSARVEFN